MRGLINLKVPVCLLGQVLFIFFSFNQSFAQISGSFDASFNPRDTIRLHGRGSFLVTTITYFKDHYYLSGTNGRFSNAVVSSFTRLDTNGKVINGNRLILEPSVVDGFLSIVAQGNTRLVAGGGFRGYRLPGQQVVNVGRILGLDEEGNPDPSFISTPGFNSSVNHIAVLPDEKLLVGGTFTQAHGQTANRLCRLMPNGALDNSFSTGVGFNNIVNTCIRLPDGKYLVGGFFTQYNGVSCGRIARLLPTGVLDNSFNIGTGFQEGEVRGLYALPNGQVWVGGVFQAYNGQPSPGYILLNANGQAARVSILDHVQNPKVKAFYQTSEGNIILGGEFQHQDTLSDYKSLMMLAPNDLPVAQFTRTGSNGGPTSFVNGMFTDAKGRLIIYGEIGRINDTIRNGIARLTMPNGRVDNTFMAGWGANDLVSHIVEGADSNIVLGGRFTTVNGEPRTESLARVDRHGNLAMDWRPTLMNEFPEFRQSGIPKQLQPIGRHGYLVQGVLLNNIFNRLFLHRIHLDGTPDTLYPYMHIPKQILTVLRNQHAILDKDTIIQPGRPLVYKIKPDGTIDPTFQCALRHQEDSILLPLAVAGCRDGKLYIACTRTPRANRTCKIFRLEKNGQIDTTFQSPDIVHGRVNKLMVYRDNRLFAAFTTTATVLTVNGRPFRSCVRLLQSGVVDTLWKGDSINGLLGSEGWSKTLLLQNNGKLITLEVFKRRYLETGYIDPEFNSTFFTPGAVLTRPFSSFIQIDGKILISGAFTQVYDTLHVRNGFARFHNCTPPPITPAIVPPPALVCLGDTLRLDATAASINPAWTYHWQFYPDNHPADEPEIDATLDERPSVKIVPRQSGTYYLVAVSEICSTARSQPVRVEVKPLHAPPQVSGPGAVCLDSATGIPVGPSVLQIVNPQAGFQYNWFAHQDSASLFTGLVWGTTMAGTYLVRSTDTDGCRSAFTPITLITSPQPNIQVFAASVDTLPVGQSMQIFVQGNPAGTATWSVDPVNGGSLQPTQGDTVVFTAIAGYSGDVSIICRYLTSLGCVAEDSFRLAVLSATTPSSQNLLKVFPNPAKGYLVIEHGETGHVQVFNALGKLMANILVQQAHQQHTLPTATWPPGVYYVRAGKSGVKVQVE